MKSNNVGAQLLALSVIVASACQASTNAAGGAEEPTPPGAATAATGTAPASTAPPTTTPDPSAAAPAVTAVPATPSAIPSGSYPATTALPTTLPTSIPTSIPTTFPATLPTAFPTAFPTTIPTALPPTGATTPVPTGDAVAKGDSILLPGNIVFQSGKAVLEATPGNEAVLDQLKRYLDKNPNVTVMRIEGHTDNVGSTDGNLKLSGERALAIKVALIAKGVAADRLMAVGFGASKPVADNATDAGRAQNRRTEFKIALLFKKPYRGLNPLGGGTEFK
jgi:OmpA-OmpF porin, OOP family